MVCMQVPPITNGDGNGNGNGTKKTLIILTVLGLLGLVLMKRR